MIKSLCIKDFALIKDIDIEFSDGLTVITGETGSGKSLLLEAMQLIFGKRSDIAMIRKNKKKAIINATFILNKKNQELLNYPRIIEITRIIEISGKNKIYLNSKSINLSTLSKLMGLLGFIHSQKDNNQNLDSNKCLSIIDNFDNTIKEELLNYSVLRFEYYELINIKKELVNSNKNDLEQQVYYESIAKEIKSYNLDNNEYNDLTIKYNKLKSFELISNVINETKESLENKIDLSLIYNLKTKLETIASFDDEYKDLVDKLSNIYYELDDTSSLVSKKNNELDFDHDEFEYIQNRINSINLVEKKYNKKIDELIEYLKILDNKSIKISDFDNELLELDKKISLVELKLIEQSKVLTNKRKEVSLNIEKLIINELKYLDLENAIFKIEFNTTNNTFSNNGVDLVAFLITFNEGEKLLDISKVASGGELARFMLALSIIIASNNNHSMIIFDEIDTGVSGKTAAKIGNKMISLSKDIQVISITHLPQVAAKAKTHFKVSKRVVKDEVISRVITLDYTNRVNSIAEMLSADDISDHALEQAKVLLKK